MQPKTIRSCKVRNRHLFTNILIKCVMQSRCRKLGTNSQREKKANDKEQVSRLDSVFWAIKPKPLNQFPLIWTGPSQGRKCQPVSFLREKQPLCLQTEHKLKIWFNKKTLFSAGEGAWSRVSFFCSLQLSPSLCFFSHTVPYKRQAHQTPHY